jgi:predicted MFS family arabinose efflux permease
LLRVGQPAEPPRPRALALLRDGAFRRLWLTGLLTGFTRWADIIVTAIFVFDATASAGAVAFVTFLRFLPMIGGALSGTLASRLPLARVLRLALGAVAVIYAALALLAVAGLLPVWAIGIGSFLIGIYWSTEMAVRRTLLGEVAGTSRISAAMGLDWGTINAARLVGPVIGGSLYESFGIGAWLATCAVMYLGSTAAIGRVPASPPPAGLDPADKGRKIFASMLDDVIASFRDPMVAGVLAVTISMNFFGFVYSSMVPVIGKEVLRATPPEVGLLSSMEGIGALVAAGAIAGVARPLWFGRLFLIGSMMTLVGALCFSQSGVYAWSLVLLTGAGMGSAIFATMQSTLILISVPGERRSRAMGVMTTTIGIGQTGVLMLGALAGWFGAATAVAVSATIGIVLLLAFAALWPAMWRQHPA